MNGIRIIFVVIFPCANLHKIFNIELGKVVAGKKQRYGSYDEYFSHGDERGLFSYWLISYEVILLFVVLEMQISLFVFLTEMW